MKKILHFLAIITMAYSCQDCQTCTTVVEDNFIEADRACRGLPSLYPGGYLVFSEYTDDYCGEDLDFLYLREGEIFTTFCPGVVASEITYVICN